MNINMILYTMENVQNVIKLTQEKQEEDCKIGSRNIGKR